MSDSAAVYQFEVGLHRLKLTNHNLNAIRGIHKPAISRDLDKTGRRVGVGVGDEWVKPGDSSWEIDYGMHSYSQLVGTHQ